MPGVELVGVERHADDLGDVGLVVDVDVDVDPVEVGGRERVEQDLADRLAARVAAASVRGETPSGEKI